MIRLKSAIVAAVVAAWLTDGPTVALDARQPAGGKPLQIYVVDVEGGNATLFVTPAGESVLIDTGNAGARDAERIIAAIKDAGLKQLDYLITTHWHGDHFGAMAEVAASFPVSTFVDHGDTVEPQAKAAAFVSDVYPTLYGKSRRTVVKPGERLALSQVDWRIVTSGGRVLQSPLPGAGARNPLCATFAPQAEDKGENAQSVGSIVTLGAFRLAHLGDLTWNKEFELMCPANPIGTVDLYIVSHHGQAISNAEVLVHALQPRVGIINNGVRKGAQPSAMKILFSSPRLEDLWQMHFSQLSGQEYTVPGLFIANHVDDQPAAMPIDAFTPPAGGGAPPPPTHNGEAHWFEIAAQASGAFTVTNTRNGFTKSYAPRR